MSDSMATWMAQRIAQMREEGDRESIENTETPPEAELVEPSANPSPVSKQNHKDTESRRWMLTLPESEYDQVYVEAQLSKYKAVIGQLESAPTTGYRHWQLYLESKSAIRFSTLRKLFPKGHYKPARETRITCVRYCTDEIKRSGPVLELGQLNFTVKQGKRTDFDSYAEQIMLEGKSAAEVTFDDHRASKIRAQLEYLELVRDRKTWGTRFRDVEVHYIHGGTRTGKTSSLTQTYGYADTYRVPNWRNPFDAYAGQDILVLDEYNTSVPMVDMLKILEGYPLEVSARYSDKIAKFTKVFIVSNLRLDQQHKTIQQEHPEQWEAFKARLTSVSEMTKTTSDTGEITGGRLLVSKGMPPQLDHYLSGKPVEISVAPEIPSAGSVAAHHVMVLTTDVDDFEDGDFDDADDLFGDD
jgi:hypothetical protein